MSESQTNPCLWLRGLIPADLVEINPSYNPSDNLNIKYIGTPSFNSGLYYGDASGGDYTSHTPLRRCGIGICKVRAIDGTQIWGAHMNLPGLVQTVARAELFFIFFLLNNAVQNAILEIVTDNLKNCETFNKGPIAASRSMNADLFKSIFSNIHNKGLKVTVRWVPSHIKEKRMKNPDLEIPSFVSEVDVEGNALADALAGDGAKYSQINDMNIPTKYIYYYHLCRKIQRRLVAILCALPSRPKHIPKVSVPREPIEYLMAQTSHFVFKPDSKANIVKCVRCKTCAKIGTPKFRAWLAGTCIAVGSADDRPIRMPYEHIKLAKNTVHHTHNMYKYLNYFYCNTCGCRSKERVRKLAKPCDPPTAAGPKYYNRNS